MKLLFALLRGIASVLLRLRVTGLTKLDFSQRAILMPNHVSLLDAALLALYLPDEVTFVVNTGIARRFAPLIKLRKHIAVDPLNPYSVRQMVREVNAGVPLVIFPEGRITTTGGLMKVYSGIGYLAVKTQALLYPIAINGAEYSKLSYLGNKLRRKWFPKVDINIGEPVRIELDDRLPLRTRKLEASERIGRLLQEHLFQSRMKPQVNLFNELLEAVRIHGTGAMICEDPQQKLSYKMLLIAAYALSRQFRKLMSADRTPVGVLLPNATAHVVTLFAMFHAGKTPAILNFSAGPKLIKEACETAGLQRIVTSKLFLEKAKLDMLPDELGDSVEIVFLEDVRSKITLAQKLRAFASYIARSKSLLASPENELILFTSGSESRPKGVVLTHRNVFANVQQARSMTDFTSQDKMFNALPMFHSFGLTAGAVFPLLCGVPVYLYPSPLHYKVIPELVYECKATVLFGTSTFLAAYGKTAHPYDFHRLRCVFAGAEKLRDEVRELWADKFGIRLFEGYGITETAPILALNCPLGYRKGTVGRLVPGVEARLEPVEGLTSGGKLLVRGPNVMKGYWIYEKGFVPAEEWFDTGDVVTIDDTGFVAIQSRLKRFAKIGGEMIPLGLVEDIAYHCYGHSEVAAIQFPDVRKGEKIFLVTTMAEDGEEAFREYVRAHGYSALLIPARIIRMENIPLLGSGKTDYVALRKRLEEEAK